MSEIQVENITAKDSNSAPNFAGGITFAGLSADSAVPGLLTPSITVSNIEPDSATVTRGNFWFNDSGSGSLSLYNDGVWWTLGGSVYVASGPVAYFGDRAIVFNASSGTGNSGNKIEYFDITSTGNSTDFGDLISSDLGPVGDRACSNGTYQVGAAVYSYHNYSLEYVASATPGNATDFGDLSSTASGKGAWGDGTLGYFHSSTSVSVGIEYITMDTPGNATSSSTLAPRRNEFGAHSNESRAVMGGGNTATSPAITIDYVDLPLASDATSFGDLTEMRDNVAGAGNETYALFMGGWNGSSYSAPNRTRDVIDYITIDTTGNATDFGNLTKDRYPAATNNATRAVAIGGYEDGSPGTRHNIIDYVTIATPGNAVDFGDMSATGNNAYATSGNAA